MAVIRSNGSAQRNSAHPGVGKLQEDPSVWTLLNDSSLIRGQLKTTRGRSPERVEIPYISDTYALKMGYRNGFP
jgi:hypothetical protein